MEHARRTACRLGQVSVAALAIFFALTVHAQVLAPVVQPPKTLIPDDGGTVCHPWFDGHQIRDTKHCAWTQNGTVPQVARSGRIPAGAGPFSDANYYSLGPGTDPLDFAGDFSACFLFDGSDVTLNHVLLSDGIAAGSGYYVQIAGGAAAQIVFNNATGAAVTPNTILTATLNCLCVGASGTNGFAKLNLGTAVTNGATAGRTTDSTHVAKLGRYETTGLAYTGKVYEAWFSTTTPSDALFTAIMQRVHSRLAITAW